MHSCNASNKFRSAFTLIELLVVIAIIAILAVVVVLTLNPAELLRQSRDSNRVSDMATLTSAINLYTTDQSGSSGFSLGSSSVIYVSIPDPNATTTAGTNCSLLSLPTLPSAYSYHCAASSTYRNIDGTGWIPVNLTNLSSGSPISNLSVDPTNTSSSRLYYSYTTNGSQFEVTSAMESVKYKLGGSNDQISGDGGPLATVYEKGSQLGLEPLDYGDSSLVGLWTMDEGTGSIAYDWSGNNATGSWLGALGSQWTTSSKIGAYAGALNGTNNSINILNISPIPQNGPATIIGWFKLNRTANSLGTSFNFFNELYQNHNNNYLYMAGAGTVNYFSPTFTTSVWHHLALTYNGTEETDLLYLDGVQYGPSIGTPSTNNGSISPFNIGSGNFLGSIDDIRVYNRVLSSAEVKALYNGGK